MRVILVCFTEAWKMYWKLCFIDIFSETMCSFFGCCNRGWIWIANIEDLPNIFLQLWLYFGFIKSLGRSHFTLGLAKYLDCDRLSFVSYSQISNFTRFNFLNDAESLPIEFWRIRIKMPGIFKLNPERIIWKCSGDWMYHVYHVFVFF